MASSAITVLATPHVQCRVRAWPFQYILHLEPIPEDHPARYLSTHDFEGSIDTGNGNQAPNSWQRLAQDE